MLNGQRLERWLWLAAFAAVLLVSRSVSVTIHPAPRPEPARETTAGIAPSGLDRSRVEREVTRAAQALERAESAYRNAQDRLQEFEEQHLEDLLMGRNASLLERRIIHGRKNLEEATTEIQQLDGVVKQLTITLSILDRELIEYDRQENPRYAPLAAEVQVLQAELTALKANRPVDHPIIRQKQAAYEKRKHLLAKTPPYLRNREIHRPNPRFQEVKIKLERAKDRLCRLRARLTRDSREDEQRLKALPGIRRRHRELKDAVERARLERERARRRHREALGAREQLATTENV
jgi:hypothetical protein